MPSAPYLNFCCDAATLWRFAAGTAKGDKPGARSQEADCQPKPWFSELGGSSRTCSRKLPRVPGGLLQSGSSSGGCRERGRFITKLPGLPRSTSRGPARHQSFGGAWLACPPPST